VDLRGKGGRLADGGDQGRWHGATRQRNGRDLTGDSPELVKAVSGLKPKAFVSRFEWLRRRPTDEPATLPVYMVFDLLELDGRDLRKEPLKVRRRLPERFTGARHDLRRAPPL